MVIDRVLCGDALEVLRDLPDESFHCCVTSPPYWGLRDYGIEGQIGLEKTPEEYVAKLVEVFREVRRVLRNDGTLWLVLGDTYASFKGACRNPGGGETSLGKHLKAAGVIPAHRASPNRMLPPGHNSLKPKDLIMIPAQVALALRADGWWLRKDIIWAKPNPMPESVKDRPTSSHEYIFLLAKAKRYYYDHAAIREPAVYGDHPRNGVPNTIVQAPGQSKQSGISRLRSEGNKTPSGWDTGPGNHRSKVGRYPKERGHARAHMGTLDEGTKRAQCSYGRNKRSVWTVATYPYLEAHFSTFPPDLIWPCILAGCPPGGIVLDPFFGAGTTGLVAKQEGRHYLGIDLDPEWAEEKAQERIRKECPMERLVVVR